MPYALNQNDIVQITYRYAQLNVVEMMNILHYRYLDEPSVTDGAAAIGELMNFLENSTTPGRFLTNWKDVTSETVVVDQVWGQKVYPVRYGKVVHDVNIAGTIVGDPVPGLVQYSITKRGDIAQRYAVGGIRVPGLDLSMENNGELAAAAYPFVDAMAAALKATITDAAGREWQPVVYRRDNPGSSVAVVSATKQTVLRSQRSRINFRGI